MKTLPDAHGARPSDVTADEDVGPLSRTDDDTDGRDTRSRPGVIARATRLARVWWPELRWPLGVYALSRVLLMTMAVIETFFRRYTLWGELGNWDGIWYLRILTEGYPSHVSHAQTPLGFFPLYSLLFWVPAHFVSLTPGYDSYEAAGVLVALITGAIATVLVGRLARQWWGEEAARRVVLFFCFFAGSVVFSMVYTEGLLLTLVAGCLLCLASRRWVLAGVLAGFATAVGPVGLAIVPACLAAAGVELWTRGWRDREARRSLIAPALAPVGALAFAAYLWIHTGDPFASYKAQRYGWQETSSPLALLHTAEKLYHQMFPAPGGYNIVNTNYVAGLIGAVILLTGLILILRAPRPTLPAIVWTLGVAALTFTSAQTPPNARMLLVAFPATVVFAQRLKGRWFTALMVLNVVMFFALNWVTYVGTDFRP